MKFIVEKLTKCTPRLGLITDITRLPGFQMETPTVLLYTKGGSIPHITREVLKIITEESQCVQIPIANTANLYESLADESQLLANFIGLKECLVYVTVQDSGNITPSGHHLQNNVPIWTRSGKRYINADSYMDTVEAFKPDMYCVLSDGDTNNMSSKKRITKAVDQTVSFLHKCLERHSKSSTLQNSMIIAAVEGGYCLRARDRCIEAIIQKNDQFGGYLIDGLHNNGPEMEFMSFDEILPVVEHIISALPENKMRIVEGCWNPVNIIKFVQMGVDVFDTSYLNLVTERSSALTFHFHCQETETVKDQEFEINMREDRYAVDFSPLVKGCTCLTCTKYVRSYLHHLINVQELLASVLLTTHNIHHYLSFFKTIRQCVKDNTVQDLENSVKKQFDDYQIKKTGKCLNKSTKNVE